MERVRRQIEAGNRRDIDAVMSTFAVDAVLEGRALGDIFEGQAAIRAFVEGWFGMYEELEFKLIAYSDSPTGSRASAPCGDEPCTCLSSQRPSRRSQTIVIR